MQEHKQAQKDCDSKEAEMGAGKTARRKAEARVQKIADRRIPNYATKKVQATPSYVPTGRKVVEGTAGWKLTENSTKRFRVGEKTNEKEVEKRESKRSANR